MFCEKCGAQIDDSAKVCPSCGCEVANAVNGGFAPQVVTIGEEPAAPVTANADAEKKAQLFGIIGIACGAIGFVLALLSPILGFILAAAGIVCSVLSMKNAKAAGVKNTLAVIGIAASVIAIVAGLINFVIGFILMLSAMLA